MVSYRACLNASWTKLISKLATLLSKLTSQATFYAMFKTLLTRIKGFFPPCTWQATEKTSVEEVRNAISKSWKSQLSIHGDLTQIRSQWTICKCQVQTGRMQSQRFQSVDDKYSPSARLHPKNWLLLEILSLPLLCQMPYPILTVSSQIEVTPITNCWQLSHSWKGWTNSTPNACDCSQCREILGLCGIRSVTSDAFLL